MKSSKRGASVFKPGSRRYAEWKHPSKTQLAAPSPTKLKKAKSRKPAKKIRIDTVTDVIIPMDLSSPGYRS